MMAGAEPASFLHRFGIDPDLLLDPYAVFSLRSYVAAMEEVAALLGDRRLGACLGQRIGPHILGPLGVLFTGAATLRTALGHLTRYLATWQEGTSMDLIEGAAGPRLTYALLDPTIWPRRQDAEFSLVTLCTLIRLRLGMTWRPRQVAFEHDAGGGASTLRSIFKAPVTFDQPCNWLVLSVIDLDQPLQAPQNPAVPFVEQHLRDISDRIRTPRTFVETVRQLIALNLGNQTLGLEGVGATMRISPRTLQRRLSEAGTSLRELLMAERREAAGLLVQRSDLSLDEIAARLGYSDATALCRAFRSWTGMSPRDFRRARSEPAIARL